MSTDWAMPELAGFHAVDVLLSMASAAFWHPLVQPPAPHTFWLFPVPVQKKPMGDWTMEAGIRYWVMVGGAELHPAVEPTLVEYCPKLHDVHMVIPVPVP